MYFDDFYEGFSFETATHVMTADAIIDFARQWDPQVFHLDPEAAKKTVYGGLIASGLHSLSVSLRLILDADIWTESSMGSPGYEDVRWLRPVRPGDVMRARGTVLSMAPSKSRPDRGRADFLYEFVDANDNVAMRYRCTQILKRRV